MRAAIVAVCLTLGVVGLFAGLFAQTATGTLNIYYIDTEGGQSTLFVGPTGESLLVDTGNAGDRDLGRIVETLKTAGIKQIDHMWTTHYHGDHVGALLALAKQFPITRQRAGYVLLATVSARRTSPGLREALYEV
jgi:glyoxylase-like metal-dependent hydrolase (beta-lactamase superfamily II)